MSRTLSKPRRATPTPTPTPSGDLHEDYPWGIRLVDHPPRFTSPEFRAAKNAAQHILAEVSADDLPYGPGPWEMHHGGSLHVKTPDGWRLFRARVGIEWSLQFCAEPGKVDRLRRDAQDLMAAFPLTVPALEAFGYGRARTLLGTPITDAAGVARWTDSIFNACVPLSRDNHQGILPGVPGEHHYPWPVKGADFIRYADFPLWITLPDGTHGAVTPLHHRGSGDGHLRLVYARHGTVAGRALAAAQAADRMAVIAPNSRLALTAFAAQIAPGSRTASQPLHARTPAGQRGAGAP
ncbi:MAG TPA: DUF6424 family protein [Jatrophihabitans sp.]|jgi:hypothetical protein|uniref:DUF6424 family protein n=1 Tax=Jatrophihabitans sp. TaxID=1932789 RepID=UPI002DF9BC06|nr:DUF6424 family protein [Jatrophihabitans sp.]